MQKLWYSSPAALWSQALPLGNGHMAAMCFGGTLQDRFSLNDGALWSAGFMDRVNPDALSHVDKVRQLIREKKYTEAEVMTEEALMAVPENMPFYELLAELTIQLKTDSHPRCPTPLASLGYMSRDMSDFEPKEGVRDYCRSLDLAEGIYQVQYELDGIRFDVPCPMKYRDPDQDLYINIPKGEQVLNGEDSVKVLRFRQYPMGDLQRNQVQQDFFRAALEQKLRAKYISKVPTLFSLVEENIKSSLNAAELLSYLNAVNKMDEKTVETFELPVTIADPYVIMKSAEAEELFTTYFGKKADHSQTE